MVFGAETCTDLESECGQKTVGTGSSLTVVG